MLAQFKPRFTDHFHVIDKFPYCSASWSNQRGICWPNMRYELHGFEEYRRTTTDSMEVINKSCLLDR